MIRKLLAIMMSVTLLFTAVPSFAEEIPVTPVIEIPAFPTEDAFVMPVAEYSEPEPEIPEIPEVPVIETPEEPVIPETPEIEIPEIPEEPTEPEVEIPEIPEVPEIPEIPEIPEEPAEPEEPTVPQEPVIPEEPEEIPETPVLPWDPTDPSIEIPVTPEIPVLPEAPEQSEVTPDVPVDPSFDGVSVELTASSAYVYANEEAIYASVTVNGGLAPYLVTVTFSADGEVQYESTSTYLESGVYAVSYLPTVGGEWKLSVTATDMSGDSDSDSLTLPVSVRRVQDDEEFLKGLRKLELTGDWRVDILTVAEYQLGYRESETNFIIDQDGNRKGYTRYGAWMGDPYSEWCASFVGYTMLHAEMSIADQLGYGSVSRWVDKVSAMGAWRSGAYEPQAGDLVFIIPLEEEDIGHMGIVEFVTDGTISTIEANVSDTIARRSYAIDDERIAGYASMEALMEYAGVEFEEHANYNNDVTELEDRFAYVNTDKVNMRAEPNVDGERLFKHLETGTQVVVTASITVDEVLWYQVEYNGRLGYIRGDLLNVDGVSEPTCACTADCPADCPCLCHGFDLNVEEDVALEELPEAPVEEPVEETLCACYDEQGAKLCAEDCACLCHQPVEEQPEEPVEEALCACYDEQGAKLCAEDCACLCHLTVEEEEPAEQPAAVTVLAQPENAAWVPGTAVTELAFAVEGDAQLQWQRAAVGGHWEDIEGATESVLSVEMTMDALGYVYRCVATHAQQELPYDENGNITLLDGTVVELTQEYREELLEREISDEVTLVRRDIAQWVGETEVTELMLLRALSASSLESLMLEGDKLVYVRTGEAIATYNPETGELTDIATGKSVGLLDAETLELMPLRKEEEEDESFQPWAEDEEA